MAPVTGSSPADNRGGPNWAQPATNPQTHTKTHDDMRTTHQHDEDFALSEFVRINEEDVEQRIK